MKKNTSSKTITGKEYEKTATRVSWVSIIGNSALSLIKLLAGIIAHSGAMISDAVHSASDVFSTIIVMIGVKISARDADEDHPYGHERFECVAAILLSAVLAVTGLMIGRSAVLSIIERETSDITVPGLPALIAAAVSIICKEAMYWYTRHYALLLDSGALMASAWHHRSDALSSIGALVGIAGARMGYPVLEPIASLVICIFILKAAIDIFRDAMRRMVDRSSDSATEESIRRCVLSQDNVLGIDLLQTREFGSRIYVDLEITADADLTLRESHKIAENVHDAIEKNFPKVKHVMIHVNPGECDKTDTVKN
ncbi:MAG: cation transporter [Firmicutes bacterium]|nr:cation transporter [Bacillota bacterium]MBQ2041621.1 cation transporter [Bacillota bacterium]